MSTIEQLELDRLSPPYNLGSPGSNYQGKHLIALTASTEIERETWGITWNMPLEVGGWLVSKTVKLRSRPSWCFRTDWSQTGSPVKFSQSARHCPDR